ncbi:CLASP_domain-containing protein [Hexamita inflata]|uniref:CLASP_domain-containing protein n=1 Tax=Hexamita inflata TaxID=28002 RepID=A0ABP1K149_9EUKA
MTKFITATQESDKIAQITTLLQQYAQFPVVLSQLTQDDIATIVSDLSSGNADLRNKMCLLLYSIIISVEVQRADFQEMLTQQFNISYILSAVYKQMKTQNDDLVTIAYNAILYHSNSDQMFREFEQIIKMSKSSIQQTQMLQLACKFVNVLDQFQLTQLAEIATTFNSTCLHNAISQATPLSVNFKKIIPSNSLQTQTESKSLFEPPSNSDVWAQSGPFSIVPSEKTSFLPFKPSKTYQLQCKTEWDTIEALFTLIEQQINGQWSEQLNAVQNIYKIIVQDNQQVNHESNLIVGKRINEFLNTHILQITKMANNLRSQLSRETLMVLELVCQRYGPCCTFTEKLITPLVVLIAKKGVYYESQAISLLKTIIIHSKNIQTELVTELINCKQPVTKAHLLDLILMQTIYLQLTEQNFYENLNQVVEMLPKLTSDPNVKVRQTARTMVNYLQILDSKLYLSVIAKINEKEKQILMQQENVAGYYQYSGNMQTQIQDKQFLTKYMQSGSCQEQLRPICNELIRGRISIIKGTSFDGFNNVIKADQYEKLW